MDITKKAPPMERKTQCSSHGEFISRGIMVLETVRWTQCPICYEEQESKRRLEEQTAITWLRKRQLNSSFSNYKVNDGQGETFRRIKKYADNFAEVRKQGSCMAFLGSPGNGKTHLAISVGITVHNTGYSVQYKRLYDLMNQIKSTYGKKSTETETEIIRRLVEFDLLILDEVGLKTLTETESALTYQILDSRYEEIKPTIIISNLSEDELTTNIGARTIDRIYENHGAVFIFDWGSHRRN